MTVSAWIAQAAADRVSNELPGLALEEWAAEDGPLTDEELDEAREALGYPRKTPVTKP